MCVYRLDNFASYNTQIPAARGIAYRAIFRQICWRTYAHDDPYKPDVFDRPILDLLQAYGVGQECYRQFSRHIKQMVDDGLLTVDKRDYRVATTYKVAMPKVIGGSVMAQDSPISAEEIAVAERLEKEKSYPQGSDILKSYPQGMQIMQSYPQENGGESRQCPSSSDIPGFSKPPMTTLNTLIPMNTKPINPENIFKNSQKSKAPPKSKAKAMPSRACKKLFVPMQTPDELRAAWDRLCPEMPYAREFSQERDVRNYLMKLVKMQNTQGQHYESGVAII